MCHYQTSWIVSCTRIIGCNLISPSNHRLGVRTMEKIKSCCMHCSRKKKIVRRCLVEKLAFVQVFGLVVTRLLCQCRGRSDYARYRWSDQVPARRQHSTSWHQAGKFAVFLQRTKCSSQAYRLWVCKAHHQQQISADTVLHAILRW